MDEELAQYGSCASINCSKQAAQPRSAKENLMKVQLYVGVFVGLSQTKPRGPKNTPLQMVSTPTRNKTIFCPGGLTPSQPVQQTPRAGETEKQKKEARLRA